jgi:tRNA-2-methylthio-N6-dimethylallyladenosine synthase
MLRPLFEAQPMRRFFVHTFGCQMNAHDSRRIEEVLQGKGYEPAEAAETADLIVFNTCSVRDKADHKLYSAVGKLRGLKEENPDVVIAVAGCLAQQQGEALLDRSDLIDVVIGPDNIAELPDLVRQIEDGGPPLSRTEFDLEAPSFLTARVQEGRPEVTAYVTVMKGCDERCTYCIVPYTRGAERYRSADDIVAEIKTLCAGGVQEITLLGQTVNSWHEPGEVTTLHTPSRFAELLRRIAAEVPELLRIRYTSPHPRHVTEALVQAHTDLAVLPAHVHLPVQSGSDRMLRLMLRRYRRQEYIERARALQQARPGFTLSTDIIVGFPGETEEDFQETVSLVREVGFSSVFAFKYSPRPHTPALRLGDDIPEEVKADRLARLFEVSDAIQAAHLRSLLGQQLQVLVEGLSKTEATRYTGRSERHEIVHVQAPSGVDLTGSCLPVRVIEANKRSLVAEPIGSLPAAPKPSSRPKPRTHVRLPLMVS